MEYKRLTVLVPMNRFERFSRLPAMQFRTWSEKINELIEAFIIENETETESSSNEEGGQQC